MIQFVLESTPRAGYLIKHLADDASYRAGACCFICARLFGHQPGRNETTEHIIPLWLQQKLRCGRSLLIASNGTKMKLSGFRLPMCQECNNNWFSSTEKAVGPYFLEQGAVDGYHLSLWLLKLMFASRYREANLEDYVKRDGSPIFDVCAVKTQMLIMRIFLTAMYRPLSFGSSLQISRSRLPLSVFPVLLTDMPKTAFYFHISGNVLALSIGGHAIIAVLDGGLTEGYFRNFARPSDPVKMPSSDYRTMCAYLAALIDNINASPFYFLQSDDRDFLDISLDSMSPYGPGPYDKLYLPRGLEHRVYKETRRGLVRNMKTYNPDSFAFHLFRFYSLEHRPQAKWHQLRDPDGVREYLENLLRQIRHLPEGQ